MNMEHYEGNSRHRVPFVMHTSFPLGTDGSIGTNRQSSEGNPNVRIVFFQIVCLTGKDSRIASRLPKKEYAP
ncbi:hypothetical protein VN12_17685 [Pirellula sp. SH-Sr6A]|nr:hypothetical protein VN12_17685 [Pirellula sp. SH-Sr6A]